MWKDTQAACVGNGLRMRVIRDTLRVYAAGLILFKALRPAMK